MNKTQKSREEIEVVVVKEILSDYDMLMHEAKTFGDRDRAKEKVVKRFSAMIGNWNYQALAQREAEVRGEMIKGINEYIEVYLKQTPPDSTDTRVLSEFLGERDFLSFLQVYLSQLKNQDEK